MRVLVIVSGAVNYYYNLTGRRIAEALTEAGWMVDLAPLSDAPLDKYDWRLLVNITEIVVAYGNRDAALRRIADHRARSKQLALVLLDAVETHWFADALTLGQAADIDLIVDLGLHDQGHRLAAETQALYRFAFNGLTATERQAVAAQSRLPDERPIPWCFIGHVTPARANLVRRLIDEFDPAGFVYLPKLGPVTEDGPHLNEEQYHRVLTRACYQLWCSHHRGFYLEGERFRLSLLTGATPIKIMLHPPDRDATYPFRYLLVDEAGCALALRELDRTALTRRFTDEFLSLPSLADSLTSVLTGVK